MNKYTKTSETDSGITERKLAARAKGGRARAAALSGERRSSIARDAAAARWSGKLKTDKQVSVRAIRALVENKELWEKFCPEGAFLESFTGTRRAVFRLSSGKALVLLPEHLKWASEIIGKQRPENR